MDKSHMLIGEPLLFIKNYVEKLNDAIKTYCPEKGLTRIQRHWLSFCVTAIIVTNSVCWSQFEKVGIGRYRIDSLSKIFRVDRRNVATWSFKGKFHSTDDSSAMARTDAAA
jgi:hypothetical protein